MSRSSVSPHAFGLADSLSTIELPSVILIDLTAPCAEPGVINESVKLHLKRTTTEVNEVGVLRDRAFIAYLESTTRS